MDQDPTNPAYATKYATANFQSTFANYFKQIELHKVHSKCISLQENRMFVVAYNIHFKIL